MPADPSPTTFPPLHPQPGLASVQLAPGSPRVPLWWRGKVVGSISGQWPDAWAAGLGPDVYIQKIEQNSEYRYALEANLDINFQAALLRVAESLESSGRSGPWRNEWVPVADSAGGTLGQVERGVVRVLGLCTQAVHLVGLRPDGAVWVQQRSLTKPNDPGLWDTLMGGTVAGSETVAETLARETWEEAGLHLAELQSVTHRGHFTATRPVPDGGGAGYLVENTHWYTANVPNELTPVNQDGEVDHFECWPPERVRSGVANGMFTPEAAWVLMQVLGNA